MMDTSETNQEESQYRKIEKKRSDLISKKLGELLLQSYRMLNETCDKCECILMQRKNEAKFCVGCNDKEVQSLTCVAPQIEPVTKQIETQKETNSPKEENRITNGNVMNQMLKNKSNQESDTYLILKSKIEWAASEMKNSENIRYNIELCELIKAVSETLISLKNADF